MKQIILQLSEKDRNALQWATMFMQGYALYLFHVGLLAVNGYPKPDTIPFIEQDKNDKNKWTFNCIYY